jgi:hypothetical protein
MTRDQRCSSATLADELEFEILELGLATDSSMSICRLDTGIIHLLLIAAQSKNQQLVCLPGVLMHLHVETA